MKKTWCGFQKWCIGINKGDVVITLAREPIFGEIRLHDASEEEFSKIAQMFESECDKSPKRVKPKKGAKR
jgi:hypothetical protein